MFGFFMDTIVYYCFIFHFPYSIFHFLFFHMSYFIFHFSIYSIFSFSIFHFSFFFFIFHFFICHFLFSIFQCPYSIFHFSIFHFPFSIFHLSSCHPISGNPFKPFWDGYSIDFDETARFELPVYAVDGNQHMNDEIKQLWDERQGYVLSSFINFYYLQFFEHFVVFQATHSNLSGMVIALTLMRALNLSCPFTLLRGMSSRMRK